MTNKTQEAKVAMCTVIQFSKLVDRPAQQFYQMLRNGAIPKEMYELVVTPAGKKQPMLHQDEMIQWWNDRLAKRQMGTVKIVGANPLALAEQVVAMFAATDDVEAKKLGKALEKVLTRFKAAEQMV